MKTDLDIEIIQSLPDPFPPNSVVSVDIELFKADKDRLHRPTGELASIQLTADGKTVYVLRPDDVSQLHRVIDGATLVFQKAYFDISHLRRWIDIRPRFIYDTMLLDRILWSGFFSTFSLADLARRYLELYLDKAPRKRFEKATEMDDEMLHYAAMDTAVTWLVLQKQLKVARKKDLDVWCEYDMPALWALLDFQGFPMDKQTWSAMAQIIQAEAEAEKAAFPFNPNAPAQVKTYFNHVIKVKPPLRNTQDKNLSKVDHPMAAKVLAYRKLAKRSSTYGMNWITNYLEPDNRVYCEWDVSEAITSRMASRTPNLQNIPIRDTTVYRECFIAEPGMVLVIGDFSAQEPRVVAFLSQDATLLEIMRGDGDIYVETARLLYHKDIEKSDPLRKKCKAIFLGLDYGMSAFGLALRLDITVDEAEKEIANFLSVFSGLKRWMEKQQSCGEYVLLATGRKMYLNKYNEKWERNALNTPVQGTAAEITKGALRLLHERWPSEFGPFGAVAVVHDEIVLHVPEACGEQAAEFLRACMIEAAESITIGVPAKADVVIGKNWAAKG